MSVRVIVPPEPIVTPADIPGEHGADDAFVTSLIAAAQEDIDGPTGWLGRALGVQTLEYRGDCLPDRLPFRPIIYVEAVTSGGDAVDLAVWRDDGALTWSSGQHRGDVVIRYRAGYDGAAVEEGGTGKVPERARQAIIMTVKHMLEMVDRDVFETQESVVGIGATTRSVTPYVSQAVRDAVESLLFRLKVFA